MLQLRISMTTLESILYRLNKSFILEIENLETTLFHRRMLGHATELQTSMVINYMVEIGRQLCMSQIFNRTPTKYLTESPPSI